MTRNRKTDNRLDSTLIPGDPIKCERITLCTLRRLSAIDVTAKCRHQNGNSATRENQLTRKSHKTLVAAASSLPTFERSFSFNAPHCRKSFIHERGDEKRKRPGSEVATWMGWHSSRKKRRQARSWARMLESRREGENRCWPIDDSFAAFIMQSTTSKKKKVTQLNCCLIIDAENYTRHSNVVQWNSSDVDCKLASEKNKKTALTHTHSPIVAVACD